MQISREVVYTVLVVLGVLVRVVEFVMGVELTAELLAVERDKEVPFSGEGGCVRGGGKDKSWVIFRSVEIGVVL